MDKDKKPGKMDQNIRASTKMARNMGRGACVGKIMMYIPANLLKIISKGMENTYGQTEEST